MLSKTDAMKKLIVFSFLLSSFFCDAQNCSYDSCEVSVFINADSCPSGPGPIILYAMSSSIIKVCAANVPSAGMPNGGQCESPSPPLSCLRTAWLYTPSSSCSVSSTITSTTIRSVYFKLADSTLLNYLGQPTAVGADFKSWLQSPWGTYLSLLDPRPLNQDYSSSSGIFCYCPTFSYQGNFGVPMDGAYNGCDYLPDNGSLSSSFNGEDPYANAGKWILYVGDVVDVGGMSLGQARITDFCMTLERHSPSPSFTWSSNVPAYLAYLSSTNVATPVFTPPAAYYDCTYYVTVYDSICDCSGTDTVRMYCPNPATIGELNEGSSSFHVTVYYSQVNFTYPFSEENRDVIIYDVSGREVVRYALPAYGKELRTELPLLAKGMYVARLGGESVSGNVKFVIE
jgi:hypothetical protein